MASNSARHLIDSFEQRLAQLQRYQPTNLITDLDPLRIDRLVKDLPESIDFMQQILGEAQRKQKERRTPRR